MMATQESRTRPKSRDPISRCAAPLNPWSSELVRIHDRIRDRDQFVVLKGHLIDEYFLLPERADGTFFASVLLASSSCMTNAPILIFEVTPSNFFNIFIRFYSFSRVLRPYFWQRRKRET